MSLKLLMASLGGTDNQILPLIDLTIETQKGGERDSFGQFLDTVGFIATIRSRGLGPALFMSAYLEARIDTVSGKTYERKELELDTTFLAVDGETTLRVPFAFVFQPLVVEYSSAMKTVWQTRLEHGDLIKQSNKMIHCEYLSLADEKFDNK
jgi:hypothetical protein